MSGSFVLPAADVVAQWTDDESCGSTEEALHMQKVVAITCEMDPIGFAQEALLLNSNCSENIACTHIDKNSICLKAKSRNTRKDIEDVPDEGHKERIGGWTIQEWEDWYCTNYHGEVPLGSSINMPPDGMCLAYACVAGSRVQDNSILCIFLHFLLRPIAKNLFGSLVCAGLDARKAQ